MAISSTVVHARNNSRFGRASSVVSLSDNDDDYRPANKRAKISRSGSGSDSDNSDASKPTGITARDLRLKQNREAAHKSRLRKKAQEQELQRNVAHYTRSNELLHKQNNELQHMLDVARAKVAALPPSSSGTQQVHTTLAPPTVSPVTVSPITPPHTPNKPSVEFLGEFHPLPVLSQTTTDGLSADDIGSDDGHDYIDILLESDEWFQSDISDDHHSKCASTSTSSAPVLIESIWPQPPVPNKKQQQLKQQQPTMQHPLVRPTATTSSIITTRIAKPVIDGMMQSTLNKVPQHQPQQQACKRKAVPMNTTGVAAKIHVSKPSIPSRPAAAPAAPAVVAPESRREKNRKAARAARLRKKMEHEKLRESVTFYTQSNEMLKKKNEELQLMILQARRKVAETTDGFQHYTTVFGGASTAEGSNGGGAQESSTCSSCQVSPPENSNTMAVPGDECGEHGSLQQLSSQQSSSLKSRRRSTLSHVDDLDVDIENIDADADMEDWMSYLLE